MVSQGLTNGSHSPIQQGNPHLDCGPSGTPTGSALRDERATESAVKGTNSGAALSGINPRPGSGLNGGTPKDIGRS